MFQILARRGSPSFDFFAKKSTGKGIVKERRLETFGAPPLDRRDMHDRGLRLLRNGDEGLSRGNRGGWFLSGVQLALCD